MLSLDPASLNEIRELDPDGSAGVLAKVIATYFETSLQLVANLRDAAAAGDTDQAMRAAHTLKSSSGFLGAKDFADVCRQIEAATREGDLASVRPLIDQVIGGHGALCDVLRREVLGQA